MEPALIAIDHIFVNGSDEQKDSVIKKSRCCTNLAVLLNHANADIVKYTASVRLSRSLLKAASLRHCHMWPPRLCDIARCKPLLMSLISFVHSTKYFNHHSI